MKISISVNTSWNIFNFRYGLLKSLISDGHEIIAISPFDEYSSILKDMGCRYISIPMDNTGINPIKDFLLFLRYLIIFIKVRPDVFLSFTIKPNIYGRGRHVCPIYTRRYCGRYDQYRHPVCLYAGMRRRVDTKG